MIGTINRVLHLKIGNWPNSKEIQIGDEKEAVASIVNYLFKKASNKQQSFEEGAYLIEDKRRVSFQPSKPAARELSTHFFARHR